MRGLYLLVLIMSLSGLAFIDYRYKLAYFYKSSQTLKILAISVIVFLVWDVAGILANIFFIGSNNLLLGLNIGEVPIEEIFFLILLNYNSLIIYLLINRRLKE